MSAIYLTEKDVAQLLTMEGAIEAVSEAFRLFADSQIENIPRGRARTDTSMLHLMGAASEALGMMAFKAYTTARGVAQFHVQLYDGKLGKPMAMIEADHLGAVRTGAMSAVATRWLARADARRVGVLGSGKQARTQLEGVAKVRRIETAFVHSPNPEHREAFARQMSASLGLAVRAVDGPEPCVRDQDIVITATTSARPVLDSDWLREGVHLNVIGSNFASKQEIDPRTIARCHRVVVDDPQQARQEAGDLIQAVLAGAWQWDRVLSLGAIVAGQQPGRQRADEITLFKSVGVGLADLAAAKLVYERAVQQGVGQPIFS